MDVLTAGIALIAVQLCVATFMAGTFYAAPDEKCTRYWAQSGALIGMGVLMIAVNAGAPNFVVLIIGNNALIVGLVFQWWGLQSFNKRRTSSSGWAIAGSFFLVYGLLLWTNAKVSERVALSAAATAFVFLLSFRELWKERVPITFARTLATFALILLVSSSAFRAFANLSQNPNFLPTTTSPIGVATMYLVPLVGTLLYSVALLLLYFERMVRDKHHLATHDELTGLLNRRAIVIGAQREIDVATRTSHPLAVAYIDVDFFKEINDRFGHEKGDAVLAELSEVLKRTCRNVDLVGRYGGEEFCIVLPRIDFEEAAIVGDRLLDAVRQHRFLGTLSVTISIGISVLSAETCSRVWTTFIDAADGALYKAKHLGRNQASIVHVVASAESEFGNEKTNR